MKETLSIPAIENGTVIDHIPAGQAMKIVKLLSLLEKKYIVTVGLNLKGKRVRKKDIVKIEGRFLSEKEAHEVAVFAPDATINIIKNYKVQKKVMAELPECMPKIFICPNTRCITQHEPVDSYFYIHQHREVVHLQCKYCEKVFERETMLTHD